MKKFHKVISAVTAAVMSCSMAASTMLTSTVMAADKTAIDIVNDMGLGWNLGNTFDCWNTRGWTTDTETAWGNPTTKKEMIDAVKAEGFDSIRIPITWYENTNASTYDIDDAYLGRIKEVIDYAYANDMYVIINMHWDWVSDGSLWLNKGEASLPQYTTMWTEIANYFKDYDQHLVFESMNEVTFDYAELNKMNQSFVDTVRKTGGNNANRLLLLAGANDDLTKTCNPEYKVPDDKMVAVSIHYYSPPTFAVAKLQDTWGYTDKWGTEEEVQAIYDSFAKVKAYYADEGIPVIMGEYGVVTNEEGQKDHNSVVKYLDTVASTALATNGVTAFLWDAGNAGDMQFYDRVNLKWFDQDYANVYKNLRENGTPIEFEYDIKKKTSTSDRTTIRLNGSPDYSIDLAPYAGQGITIKQVILNGTPEGGWGVSFPATNPDGSHRDWTSEAGAVGADGTCTIDIDGIFVGDNDVTENYVLDFGGNMDFAKWWGPDDAVLESVTLVFDKEITYTELEATATAKKREQKPTEPEVDPTESEPDTSEATETDTSEEIEQDTTKPTETEPDTTKPTEVDPTEDDGNDTLPTETQEDQGIQPTKLGDADLNDEVNILDVIAVNRAILGKDVLPEQAMVNIDFNKNGYADASESLAILKYLVKIFTEEDLIDF